MNTQEELEYIDHSAIKVNQSTLITLNILAYVFNAPFLAAIVAVMMLLGTILKRPDFAFLYRYVLKPLGLAKPDLRLDNNEPHRFAQGLGSLFMIVGVLALFSGASALGWVLVWLVTFLAALNLFAGLCVGCMVYYWLNRLDVPGFRKSPPEGTFPGMRPKTRMYHEP